MPTCRTAVKCRSAFTFVVDARLFGCVMTAAMLLIAAMPVARADDDLPGRVGRIAEFAGQLYLSPEDRATEWQPIGLNYPVSSGDNLWVSGDGRAEVDYGGGQFRLAAGPEVVKRFGPGRQTGPADDLVEAGSQVLVHVPFDGDDVNGPRLCEVERLFQIWP